MNGFRYIMLPLLFFVQATPFSLAADLDSIGEITIIVPEGRIKKILAELTPFRINPGKGFSGTFRVKDVEKIKLGRNTLSFTTHIYGKNISYMARIGKQNVQVELGDVDSRNRWSLAFRYERKSRTFFLKPHVEGSKNRDSLERGDFLLDSLLLAMGDIEYPVEVDKIKPFIIKTLFGLIQVKVDISNIHTESGKVFIEIVPSVRKSPARSNPL